MWSNDPLCRQAAELCRQEGLLPPGGRILAAVSGGADSMCLLHLLWSHQADWGITVAAAHYNHGLRGAEADEDEAYVRRWCAERGIPLLCGRGDVAGEAARQKAGIEETARTMRYEFLARAAEEWGAERIATAHNREDNSETILLHLVRGAGVQGLTGILPRRGNLIRPLLCTGRREILRYDAEYGIAYREDSTNGDPAYTRNYIRHQVLPLLRQVNPAVDEALLRTAESARTDTAWWNEQLNRQVVSRLVREPGRVTLPVPLLRGIPQALRLRAVQVMAQEWEPERILSRVHRLAAEELILGAAPSGTVNLPGGARFCRRYDTLYLEHTPRPEPLPEETTLALPGEAVWGGSEIISAHLESWNGQRGNPRRELYLRTEGAWLRVRSRRTGDRLTLPGRPGKPVKKWLIETKIPREERDRIPVLETETGELCGVFGLGTEARFQPRMGERVWHIVRSEGSDRMNTEKKERMEDYGTH